MYFVVRSNAVSSCISLQVLSHFFTYTAGRGPPPPPSPAAPFSLHRLATVGAGRVKGKGRRNLEASRASSYAKAIIRLLDYGRSFRLLLQITTPRNFCEAGGRRRPVVHITLLIPLCAFV